MFKGFECEYDEFSSTKFVFVFVCLFVCLGEGGFSIDMLHLQMYHIVVCLFTICL